MLAAFWHTFSNFASTIVSPLHDRIALRDIQKSPGSQRSAAPGVRGREIVAWLLQTNQTLSSYPCADRSADTIRRGLIPNLSYEPESRAPAFSFFSERKKWISPCQALPPTHA